MIDLWLCFSLSRYIAIEVGIGIYRYISMEMGIVFQLLSCVWLFVTLWTEACQASLSFTISLSFLKLMSVESVMPSNHLILCHPLLFLPSMFPSIKVFSKESTRHTRWPKIDTDIEVDTQVVHYDYIYISTTSERQVSFSFTLMQQI